MQTDTVPIKKAMPMILNSQLFPDDLKELIKKLHIEFNSERLNLLSERKKKQAKYDNGELPTYLDKNSDAVTGDWSVASIPNDLLERRVEITGPVNDPKMVINMLSRNSTGFRADTAMVDFEDSMKPSWKNIQDGYRNVIGASIGKLEHSKYDKNGNIEKTYALNPEDMAVLMVRVRGLHLDESNYEINNESVSGGLLDLVVCFYHSAKNLIERGKTPKFYIPKCEHYLEARWWAKLMDELENNLDFPKSTIRATFLIETLPGAFQIEEILYEGKDHIVGLNVGRWDKIFSDIKVLKCHKDRITSDRANINMSKFWMDNYAKRLIKICHERGAFAIGGMSAFTPGNDPEIRKVQTEKVKNDKQNEANIGHDGCWVSHPYFIGVAMEAFTKKNQLHEKLKEFDRYPDLILDGEGPQTLEGLRTNIRVGIAYLQGWNSDLGCVAWDNLMEDLATLEISRAQTWQWLHHKVVLDNGSTVSKELISDIFDQELNRILCEIGENMKGQDSEKIENVKKQYAIAKNDALVLFLEKDLKDFLSLSSDKEIN